MGFVASVVASSTLRLQVGEAVGPSLCQGNDVTFGVCQSLPVRSFDQMPGALADRAAIKGCRLGFPFLG